MEMRKSGKEEKRKRGKGKEDNWKRGNEEPGK
jgi:hypothetical protein